MRGGRSQVWHDVVYLRLIKRPPVNNTLRVHLSQRWFATQEELLPFLRAELEGTTPKLEQVIRTLEWVRVEEHIEGGWCGFGRPPRERCDLARAFVAKAVLGFEKTREIIERLEVDSRLKRICGFSMYKALPSEATFSRAFAEFANLRVAQRTHEALIEAALGNQLIGHVSRDSTAIHARESVHTPPKKEAIAVPPNPIEALCETIAQQTKENTMSAPQQPCTAEAAPRPNAAVSAPVRRRGRPKKGETRPAPPLGKLALQRQQALPEMLAAIPKACDIGTKKNAKGLKESWKGYKLHLDTADCGVPLNALVSSASMHDSLAAIPLAILTAQRVTSCYDLMDSAYCSQDIREHSRSLGHVPLIEHNPRNGEKNEFLPHEAHRYKERSQAERTNARLKDEFGLRQVWFRGHSKISSHMNFAVLALAADQIMRLLQ
jgi:hypothetical protein